jgi:hypothetical protein
MTDFNDQPRYPWAELYDVESGVNRIANPQPGAGPGRPRKPVSRLKTSITLTDDEKRLYEKLTYELGTRLHPRKVTRGQVIGLALRLLETRTDDLPVSLESWESVAEILFQAEANQK